MPLVNRRWFLFGADDAQPSVERTLVTLPEIRAFLMPLIEDLTPTRLDTDRFRRREGRVPLRQQPATSALFRRFELRAEGRRNGGGQDHADAVYVQRRLRLEVAYPTAVVGLYGTDDLDDLADIMDADGRQLRDLLASPANVTNEAHVASFLTIDGPDRRSAGVWFLRLAVDVRYFTPPRST